MKTIELRAESKRATHHQRPWKEAGRETLQSVSEWRWYWTNNWNKTLYNKMENYLKL